MLHRVQIDSLDLAYYRHGSPGGHSVLLLHGFPYAPSSYDDAARALAQDRFDVIVPYLRGYGPTRFRDPAGFRSGEQAALGQDAIDLIIALDLERPIVAGYDWGGRAACVASALRPDLIGGLVTVCGYNIFGPPVTAPLDPRVEHMLWYQYYLHMPRGRDMLEQDRNAFCRYLWEIWSPGWMFSDSQFDLASAAFQNDDFVEVVLHSYRHRAGLVPGDPSLLELAAELERQPPIGIPTIVLHGDRDMAPLAMSLDRSRFTDFWERRVVAGAGHNLPQETPGALAAAITDLAAHIG